MRILIIEDNQKLADNHARSLNKKVDMSLLVQDVALRMKTLSLSKGISISLSAPDSIIVAGTKEQLERAILNILQNAIDHTPRSGSITVDIQKIY